MSSLLQLENEKAGLKQAGKLCVAWHLVEAHLDSSTVVVFLGTSQALAKVESSSSVPNLDSEREEHELPLELAVAAGEREGGAEMSG